jgi:hypothetical protein
VELVAACRGGKSEGSDRALGRGVVEDLFAGDAAGEPVVEQQRPEDVDAEDLVIGQ